MDTVKLPEGADSNNGTFANDSSIEVSPQATAIPPKGSDGSITWTASEFVEHKKNFVWYLILLGITLAIAAAIWFLTKDKIAIASVAVVAAVLAIMAAKKPRELEYRVDRDGLHIAGKDFPFNNFRSFSIIRQGSFSSLAFRPLKRFALLATAYYDPTDEQKILDIVSRYLPMEEQRLDLIDDVMWRLHF